MSCSDDIADAPDISGGADATWDNLTATDNTDEPINIAGGSGNNVWQKIYLSTAGAYDFSHDTAPDGDTVMTIWTAPGTTAPGYADLIRVGFGDDQAGNGKPLIRYTSTGGEWVYIESSGYGGDRVSGQTTLVAPYAAPDPGHWSAWQPGAISTQSALGFNPGHAAADYLVISTLNHLTNPPSAWVPPDFAESLPYPAESTAAVGLTGLAAIRALIPAAAGGSVTTPAPTGVQVASAFGETGLSVGMFVLGERPSGTTYAAFRWEVSVQAAQQRRQFALVDTPVTPPVGLDALTEGVDWTTDPILAPTGYEIESDACAVAWLDTVVDLAHAAPDFNQWYESAGHDTGVSFDVGWSVYVESGEAVSDTSWQDTSTASLLASWSTNTPIPDSGLGSTITGPATVDLGISAMGAAPIITLITQPTQLLSGDASGWFRDVPQISQTTFHDNELNALQHHEVSALDEGSPLFYSRRQPRWRYWVPPPKLRTVGGHWAAVGGATVNMMQADMTWIPIQDGV